MYLHISKKSRTFAPRKDTLLILKNVIKMKTYKTFISHEEELLLLTLLNDFMLGAKKEWTNRNFDMCLKNDHCSLVLTPENVETLGSLFSKYDMFSEHHQKLLDWIIEE